MARMGTARVGVGQWWSAEEKTRGTRWAAAGGSGRAVRRVTLNLP